MRGVYYKPENFLSVDYATDSINLKIGVVYKARFQMYQGFNSCKYLKCCEGL